MLIYLRRILKQTTDKLTYCIVQGLIGSTIAVTVMVLYDINYSVMFLWMILGPGIAVMMRENKNKSRKTREQIIEK